MRVPTDLTKTVFYEDLYIFVKDDFQPYSINL